MPCEYGEATDQSDTFFVPQPSSPTTTMTKTELTVYYAEPTLCLEFEVEITPETTIGEVHGKVHEMLEEHLGEVMQNCNLKTGKELLYPSIHSITIVSHR